tara:strand:- start:1132 stop:1272 length:141 start_codon:yes stop_codon:yes gene_type:complete
MSDFDIGFLLFYVFVGVVMIPIAYMLDKRREEAMKINNFIEEKKNG